MVKMNEKKLAAIGRWGVMLPPALLIGVQGIGKFADSGTWEDKFVAWGLPAEMVLPIAALQLLGVVLMLVAKTRFYGAALLAGIMVGAFGTHLGSQEWGQSFFPLVLGFLAGVTAWWARPVWVDELLKREAKSED